jgi:hypothetical protein
MRCIEIAPRQAGSKLLKSYPAGAEDMNSNVNEKTFILYNIA